MSWRRAVKRASGAGSLLLLLLANPTAARYPEPLDPERSIADRITATPQRGWAVLPVIGYSPDKSGNAGVKLAVHGLPPGDLSTDFEGIFAMKGQTQANFHLISPEFFSRYLLLLVQGTFRLDPAKEFFGLGNNNSGPDELSSNEEQLLDMGGSIGVRPMPRLTVAAHLGYRTIDVRHGKLEGNNPSTKRAFPRLVGIDGGETMPIAASVTFNNRRDPTRPTQGWILMAKAEHDVSVDGNDFDFERYTLDVSYLLPLPTRRQVLGLRFGGELLRGGNRKIPFYELSSLGSAFDLRGYFLDRFFGDSSLLFNTEYRLKLVDFNLFWFVQIDGVLFGDVGRVFIDSDRLEAQSGCPPPGLIPLEPPSQCRTLPRTEDAIRFSYGGGTRIALGKALVARIDVGFSEEETGLVYLTFGQTF